MQDPLLTPIFLLGMGLEAAAVVGTVGPFTITAGGIASVLSTATIIGAAVAVNYYMQPDVPKPEQGTIPLRQTVPPRIFGFGEVRLAGNYVFYEVAGPLSVDIIALCQGPVGGFKKFFLDDAAVFVDPGSGQTGVPETTLPEYQASTLYANKGPKLNLSWREWVPTALQPTWTDDFRGDRVSSMLFVSINTPTADFLKVYPHGLPKPSAAVFLPCWDFRDGTQNPDDPDSWVAYSAWAGGTHSVGDRVMHGGIVVPFGGATGGMLWLCVAANTGIEPGTNPFYWAPVWKNPVLQTVTYLTSNDFGMGLPRARLITPALARLTAEAALCDAPVERGDGNYEPRYSSCPWFKFETEPTEVLAQILASCDGWLSIDGDGSLAMRVGVFDPPTVTLDNQMIISVELNYGAADEDKVDELTLTYTSPDHNYTTQAVDSWRDEEAILNRGKVRSQAFGPASVQSHTQVRRLAKRIFLRSNSIKGSITTHLGGMVAAGQRYVLINYDLIPELNNVTVELRRRETDLAARQCRFEFVIVDPELLEGWVPAEEAGPPPIIPIEPTPAPVETTLIMDNDFMALSDNDAEMISDNS